MCVLGEGGGGVAANYQLLCPMVHFASSTVLVHADHSDHILISSYPVWEATVLFPRKMQHWQWNDFKLKCHRYL